MARDTTKNNNNNNNKNLARKHFYKCQILNSLLSQKIQYER